MAFGRAAGKRVARRPGMRVVGPEEHRRGTGDAVSGRCRSSVSRSV
jgi:hypothetical protein